jgi:two-component system OmpR family sensor kinase
MKRPRRAHASGLAVRIYVVMILAIAVVVAVLIFKTPQTPPLPAHDPPPPNRLAQALYEYRDDVEALRVELARIKADYNLDATLYGAGGHLIASANNPPPPPATADELQRVARDGPGVRGPLRRPPGSGPRAGPGDRMRWFGMGAPTAGRGQLIIPLSADGDHAILQFQRRRSPPIDFRIDIIIVLVALALASLVLARMLARPLQHIATAARAFGAGDLTARSRLSRRDELGELSRTFDEMAERITQLMRGQRELLASVSHELRTPLSRIRVALELAAEGDPRSAHQSLSDITEDLAELEDLVNDVLAMARLEGQVVGTKGIPRVRTEQVDARQVAGKAATRFAGTHAGREVDLQLGGSDEPPIVVEADPSLLRRVIENLLDNAHKYSPADVPIRLSVSVEHDSAVFTVIDRGQGIAPGDLPDVFAPFFRADRSRTRGTGGVGLGLALSRRIVEAHGGHIAIESELDEGSTVTFTVPLAGTSEIAQ